MPVEPKYCAMCGGPLTRREYRYDQNNYILVCANSECPMCDPVFMLMTLDQRVRDMDNVLITINNRLTGLLDQLEVHSNGKITEVHQ